MLGSGFQLVKIQTYVLKVQIHCDGCARKVKKLLKKIDVDAEKHKVKVSGTVDCAKLIRKLMKAGKHAEVWSPAHDQNQNQSLQALPSWLVDDPYQNNLIQGQNGGAKAFENNPVIIPPDFDWRRQKYLDQSRRMNSLVPEGNNFGATTLENNPQFGWNEDIAPDQASRMEDNNRISMAFLNSRNTGFEEKGYPGFQQLLSPPEYGHHYAPFAMRNNSMQQYKFNLPSSNMMMNLQYLPVSSAYEHYSPPLVMSHNLQQKYQASSPAYEHFDPHLAMHNNMHHYQYNLSSP